MRLLAHRLRRWAQLPLLLASLWTWSGGWFCADGRQCEPPTRSACCCGEGEEGAAPLARIKAPACGCYFRLDESETLAGSRLTLEPAVLPAPGVAYSPGDTGLILPLRPRSVPPREPPSLRLCAPRGPPAA
ncbi:MAG: hypothetical protein ACK47B_09715 [Armatimonadota bacterium]